MDSNITNRLGSKNIRYFYLPNLDKGFGLAVFTFSEPKIKFRAMWNFQKEVSQNYTFNPLFFDNQRLYIEYLLKPEIRKDILENRTERYNLDSNDLNKSISKQIIKIPNEKFEEFIQKQYLNIIKEAQEESRKHLNDILEKANLKKFNIGIIQTMGTGFGELAKIEKEYLTASWEDIKKWNPEVEAATGGSGFHNTGAHKAF